MLRAAPSARVLSALQPTDLVTAAEILLEGGVAALPFNGVYALVSRRRLTAASAELTLPEDAPSHVAPLLRELHALGVMLPEPMVWTEYGPLRTVMERVDRPLHAEPLEHTSIRDVFREYFTRVDAIVAADFSDLAPQRRRPPTIVDLSQGQPRLHCIGSVRVLELQDALTRHGFGTLRIGPTHLPAH